MRRDVWRVGLGRFLLEGALGVVLVQRMGDQARLIAIAAAVLAAVAVHLGLRRGLRRAFWAAHLALGSAALAAHVTGWLSGVLLAAGLGASIELAHIELLDRQRVRESPSTLRIPASLWVRRLGSVVVGVGVGEATIPLSALAVNPSGLAPIFVVLGAIAMLTAGFGAGPGRPVTRPIDALSFVLLATLLAIPGGWLSP